MKLPLYDDIRDFVFPTITDARVRYLRAFGTDSATNNPTAADTATVITSTLGRVTSVQLRLSDAAASDCVVQVQVNGRDVLTDAERPTIVTGATVSNRVEIPAHSPYIAGETVTSIVETVDAAQTGTITVLYETEPYTLEKRPLAVTPSGRQRLKGEAEKASYVESAPTASPVTGRTGAGAPPSERLQRNAVDPIPERYRNVELPPHHHGGGHGGAPL